jgi:hypothetical protein
MSADERGDRAFWLAGKLLTLEARDQLLEQDELIEAGEMLAEAGVGS